ncbi:MAG: rRNA maturation RNase YbeY [Bacteroidota bacterium]|nr:rRNA maturation RNase YbeY [Bacteroidota bacterium]
MHIEVFHEIEGQKAPFHPGLNKILLNILEDHGRELSYMNIVVMDDEQLLQINRDFLQHDDYTDVITFNYAEEGIPVEAELYLSLPRIEENALIFGRAFAEELHRVVVHGTLHLAGYQDDTQIAKKEMQVVENKYLAQLSFT